VSLLAAAVFWTAARRSGRHPLLSGLIGGAIFYLSRLLATWVANRAFGPFRPDQASSVFVISLAAAGVTTALAYALWFTPLGAGVAAASERFGHMLSRTLLTVLYFGVLGPFALLHRIGADPLRLRRPRDTNWTRWTGRNDTLARARRQD
jgi:hypothetical protein